MTAAATSTQPPPPTSASTPNPSPTPASTPTQARTHKDARQLVQHPVLGCSHALQMLLGAAGLQEEVYYGPPPGPVPPSHPSPAPSDSRPLDPGAGLPPALLAPGGAAPARGERGMAADDGGERRRRALTMAALCRERAGASGPPRMDKAWRQRRASPPGGPEAQGRPRSDGEIGRACAFLAAPTGALRSGTPRSGTPCS